MFFNNNSEKPDAYLDERIMFKVSPSPGLNLTHLRTTWPWSANMFCLIWIYACISWILHHLQAANHSQLWMVTQTNTNYALLVLCVACERRPLVYHENQRPLVSHENFLCVPTTNPPLSLKFALLISLKTSDRGCNPCGRLRKQTSGN